ncbi:MULTISPECIES: Arm DNA-binding domain-containing protein [Pseudomonadota]|jgi:hypothetical protein|uniref:Integrase DNA-binding domain-containing protein n=1 Tax=Sphingobium yanoikuyae TaxID=13690 RepID=A0A0J9FVJ9_SPHYA|nr:MULTISPECIES: Arm DNA-binding domain-containing protein [Sphingobium]ATP20241.1 hypothetical protein BV87_18815 [Sphingobium yanoikuyae]KMW32225.1 hypothetical protein BV87_18100 [Sphingobium yanoikuyae]TKV40722.1 hypothetical protein A0U87_05620 [Sphingobium sp. MP9-4]
MATGKISKRTVDAFRDEGTAGFLWDVDLKGFGLKVTTAGNAIYVLQYRLGGREAKTRRFTIGNHGSPWTPVTARTEAERLSIFVAQGIDPQEVDRQRRREAVDLAFSTYVGTFANSYRGSGWANLIERSAKLHITPILGSKPLPNITRADVVSVFDRMPDAQAANRRNVFAVLRRMFKWAVTPN